MFILDGHESRNVRVTFGPIARCSNNLRLCEWGMWTTRAYRVSPGNTNFDTQLEAPEAYINITLSEPTCVFSFCIQTLELLMYLHSTNPEMLYRS